MVDVHAREKNCEGDRENERIKKRALKTDRIEENMAMDRHFKPIIKPLQQIVDSPMR